MHNNFELNETTGVGLIKDDKDNNILIKTDANEKQLTAILEKENEIECEQDKINRIKKLINSYNDIMLTKTIFYFISTIFFIFACDAFIDFEIIKGMYGFPSLAIVLVGPYLSIKLGTFKYNLNQRKKLEEGIEESSYKTKKLKEELERLKSKVQIEEMNTNDIVTSSINYPIRSEEENINSYYNAQSGPIKFKSLRKEFEK